MPPVLPDSKACERCSRALALVSTTPEGQRLEATSKRWFVMARKGGRWAVRCPECAPPATPPSTMGRTTP
jgi:Fe-S-cluster-containing hydrogenase component 2